MSATATVPASSTPVSSSFQQPRRSVLFARYLRRNKSLAVGLAIVLFLALFTVVGLLTIKTKNAYPLSVRTKQPPSAQFPLGTDWYGRDLTAAMVVGLWQTALIGLLAGGTGTLIGVVLGFISAYYGGSTDRIITGICQILQPIPGFLIQVVIAGSIDKKELDRQLLPGLSQGILIMAGVVVLLAWMGPTLVIRSQVLSMKERMFVNVARLSGMSNLEIIFKELLPNLVPFIAASFVGAVLSALFASFGLSALGLGPLREPLMGNIIYFAQQQSAIFNGWWWWPLWPALMLILIFAALTLINVGLDEVANPRVRRTE